jgi:hypothetical protein
MNKLKEFEEFDYKEHHITTDLGSAHFHFDSGKVTIQGHAYGETKRQVEVHIEPEDTADFNVSISGSNGELTARDFERTGRLQKIVDIETQDEL